MVHVSVHIWTEILAGTENQNLAGTETGISVKISAGTGTEPNFGRSLPYSTLYYTFAWHNSTAIQWHLHLRVSQNQINIFYSYSLSFVVVTVAVVVVDVCKNRKLDPALFDRVRSLRDYEMVSFITTPFFTVFFSSYDFCLGEILSGHRLGSTLWTLELLFLEKKRNLKGNQGSFL